MDNKRLVIVIVVSMAVVFIWTFIGNRLREAHPEWFAPPAENVATTQPTQPAPATAAPGPTTPATAPGAIRIVAGDADVKPYTMGLPRYDADASSPYPVALTTTPQGAALDAAILNRFKLGIDTDAPYAFQQPYQNVPAPLSHALATRQLVVNGVSQDVWDVAWDHAMATPGMVRYELKLTSAGKPLLNVEKRYDLQPATDPSLGYEVLLTYTYRNPTTRPVTVKTIFNGPNVPPAENTRDIPEVVAGYNDEMQVEVVHHPASSFAPDKPAMNLQHAKGRPLLWAGVISAYFNAIVRPEVTSQGATPSLAQVTAVAAAPRDPKTGREHLVLTFETAELTVPPGGQVVVPLRVYVGPRQRAVLNTPYYAAFPLNYDRTLVLTSGPCGWCTFQWLINLLVAMLSGFFWLFGGFAGHGDWGLAIIALVLVVRLLLHPITKKSQISMSKMSKMGPEMERLKKKYGDNKEELNRAMMAFYKEQGFTPILGCLPMLLQMPIWIALWSALQSTMELRLAPLLWGMTWIDDLSQPDRLIWFPNHPINLWFTSVDALNLLPVLMAVVFYLQQKMTPKPAVTTPEQAQQQKMMQWMTLLFPLLLYSSPSGLNLYILTSTAIGIWESKRVRDHIQAQEEAERAQRVIIDAPATRSARRHARQEHEQELQKSGCLTGWLDNLQKKAEEIRQASERRDRGRK